MKTRYIIKNFDGVQLYGNSSFSSFREAWDYIYQIVHIDYIYNEYYVVPEPQ